MVRGIVDPPAKIGVVEAFGHRRGDRWAFAIALQGMMDLQTGEIPLSSRLSV
jgi:hypothetical protein